jgi:hypothetical protein
MEYDGFQGVNTQLLSYNCGFQGRKSKRKQDGILLNGETAYRSWEDFLM